MENLMFSLNATMPVFLLMVAGYFLHKICLIDDRFADRMNNFVFKAALPVHLFPNLSASDVQTVWNGSMILFCFVVSLLSILIMAAISLLLQKRSLRAEFIQAGYRGSQALLGAALLQNIYGDTGPLALVLIGAVPLYNVAAVVVLTLLSPEGGRLDRKTVGKTLRGLCWASRSRSSSSGPSPASPPPPPRLDLSHWAPASTSKRPPAASGPPWCAALSSSSFSPPSSFPSPS